jgi:arylsulfatase A-like enzyme
MRNRWAWAWVAGLLLASPVEARNNFLILVADDFGVDGVGVYSRDDLYGHPGEGASPGPTPTLDALAADGVLFRNAYATPTCSSTRAATLSGRLGFRTGVGRVGGQLDVAETTLPELVAATHHNAALGKWHIGGNDADHPIDSGFDYYAGGLGGGVGGDYFSWTKVTNSASGSASTENDHDVYATSDAVDEALGQIAAFGDDEWLVWVAFNAPHSPFHVPPSGLTTLAVDDGSSDTLKYEAAVEAMDSEIGRLLAGIPASVLADTTVIFLGDNGTPRGVVEAPFDSNRAKGSVYEGGINVPLIVTGPWIDPADEGSESLAVVQTTDLFATIAEIVGVASTAEDSVSLVPYLADPALPTTLRRPYAYGETFSPNGFGPYTTQERGIRDDRYKLIWRDGVYEEFFDLDADPFEDDNLLVLGTTPEEDAAFDALALAMERLHDPTLAACEDGLDNDGDGAVDHPDDTGCASPSSGREDPPPPSPPSGCGMGPELALLLPPLFAGLRRRR